MRWENIFVRAVILVVMDKSRLIGGRNHWGFVEFLRKEVGS